MVLVPVRRNQDHENSEKLPFATDVGTRINWGDLATFIIGILTGEFYVGLSSFLGSLIDNWVLYPITGTTDWVGQQVYKFTGGAGTTVTEAFANSIAWVAGRPIVGFVIALGSTLLLAYAFSRVIPRG